MTRFAPGLTVGMLAIACTTAGDRGAPGGFDPTHGSLARLEPRSIYARDRNDPWNLVFHLLFDRAIRSQLVAPGAVIFGGMDERLRLSDRHLTRIEDGDRAVEPLYPSWLWMGSGLFDTSPQGSWQILRDPRFNQFVAGLKEVETSATSRPPLARALMQADLWAVYDMFHATSRFASTYDRDVDPAQLSSRRDELLVRLAATIRALALTRSEISALPDNYASAARAGTVPDVFNPRAGWIEIQWLPERMHDRVAQFRRVARVFLQPAHPPADEAAFLNRFREEGGAYITDLSAAALVTENLLVASDGTVVPSPITFDVQIRRLAKHDSTTDSNVEEHELSRRLLLANPASGGFVRFDANAPAYLPMAGNDLSFATLRRPDSESVLGSLGDRCTACHGPGAGKLFTFSVTRGPDWVPPPVQRLDPSTNARAHVVADAKQTRGDFTSLQKEWFANGR